MTDHGLREVAAPNDLTRVHRTRHSVEARNESGARSPSGRSSAAARYVVDEDGLNDPFLSGYVRGATSLTRDALVCEALLSLGPGDPQSPGSS